VGERESFVWCAATIAVSSTQNKWSLLTTGDDPKGVEKQVQWKTNICVKTIHVHDFAFV